MPTLLVTRLLSEAAEAYGRSLGLTLEANALMELESLTASVELGGVQEKLEQKQFQAWAFTSQYAVAALPALIGQLDDDWGLIPEKLFAVGNQTAEALLEIGLKPQQLIALNAAQLAQIIAQDKTIKQVLHPCGEDHRAELEAGLAAAGIGYMPLVLYRTVTNPGFVRPAQVDAIAFFSPAGARLYFESFAAKADFDLPLFAVGSTTARALTALGARQVMTAEKTAARAVLDAAARYFKLS